MNKLGKREFPAGLTPEQFTYCGRPAKDQGDFGPDVGLADMACVNQFGEANNAKFYHMGVVVANGRHFLYCEWGRCKPGQSWNGTTWTGNAQDFQFVEGTEAEVRKEFAAKGKSKNTSRLERRTVGGVEIWAAKAGDDGYLVQQLATREKGLPDARKIKDSSGVVTAPKAPVKVATVAPTRKFQSQVVDLATALVGGTKSYTRALSTATGITPTMSAINLVRNSLVPAALARLQVVGSDVKAQVRDRDLRDISKQVAAMVPRNIPRSGITDEEAILNSGNILTLQSDLDAFESALTSEDFSTAQVSSGVDPDSMLNANLEWLDPKDTLGRWVTSTYLNMTRNVHSDFHGAPKVYNVFRVSRPDRDSAFLKAVRDVGQVRRGVFGGRRAELQPTTRTDLTPEERDLFGAANVFLGIHGTRAVNVAPILQSNLRLPKSLSGVHITGAAFGHGIYFADDFKKSWGYTGGSDRWGNSGGGVSGRRKFMFLCDVVLGDPFMVRNAWSLSDHVPDRKDSVYAHREVSSVHNNEYVIFNASYQRIRYVVEMDK